MQQSPEEPVWVGDRNLEEDKQGLMVLGAPVGSDAYVRKQGARRLDEEKVFWDTLPGLPDLQSAWLLLLLLRGPKVQLHCQNNTAETCRAVRARP